MMPFYFSGWGARSSDEEENDTALWCVVRCVVKIKVSVRDIRFSKLEVKDYFSNNLWKLM